MTGVAGRKDIFLLPGELHIGQAHERVHTLLGSCIAVTLWNPVSRIGGICHYLLPSASMPPIGGPNGRYGDIALGWLMTQFAQRGVTTGELEAKIIGGGALLRFPHSASFIGEQNISLARRLLAEAGIKVMAEDVGRSGYRQLIFDIADGSVWVRYGDGAIGSCAG